MVLTYSCHDFRCGCTERYSLKPGRDECVEWSSTAGLEQCGCDLVSRQTTVWPKRSLSYNPYRSSHRNSSNSDTVVSLEGSLYFVILFYLPHKLSQRWPRIGPIKVDTIMLPIIYMVSHLYALDFRLLTTQSQYSSNLSAGVNSAVTSSIIVGLISQLWLRRYHPGWYKKYNYILGGALDGGAQVMTFILSFAVFGASGTARPFPYVC